MGGGVNTGGGSFAGRDSVNSAVQGSVGNLTVGPNDRGSIQQGEPTTFSELADQLRSFLADLQSAEISPGLKRSVQADIETVLAESDNPEPEGELIVHKIDSVDRLVGGLAESTSSLTNLAASAHRLFEWACSLFQ